MAPVQESIVQVAAPMPDPGEIKFNYPKPEPFKAAPEIVKIPDYKPKYPEFTESVNDWMNTIGLEAQIPRDWEYHKMPPLPGNYRPYDGLGYIQSGLTGLNVEPITEANIMESHAKNPEILHAEVSKDLTAKDVYQSSY